MMSRKPLAVRVHRRAGVAGVLAALLLGAGPAVAAPAPPPPPPLTGEHLGADRLPSCQTVVEAMTLRDRLAQRLMVGVDAGESGTAAENVRATQIGGIFLRGNATELLTDEALRRVQATSRIPLAVAVDDEGGRVQRLDELDGELPSARRMASTLDPEQVRELGRERGQAQIARGVTMNLAPIVDVTGRSAAIGDRAFGDDPETVATYAGAFAEGQREAGVFTMLKHFPGHGRANGDSHEGRVTTPTLDQLREVDLRPYTALLGPEGSLTGGDTGVLVGHLDVPGLTGQLPSSLAPAVYELLRTEVGFDGLVLTDDLGAMDAITDAFALAEAVEKALAAGADMALWSSGGRITPVLDHLEEALAAGELDATANDTAVTRVLKAKRVCS